MPTTTIPLVGPATARGWAKSIGTSAKDQQFINVFYDVATDTQAQSKNVYCQKRGGSVTGTSIASGVYLLISDDAVAIRDGTMYVNSTNVYNLDSGGTVTNCGTISGIPDYRAYCGGLIGTKKVISLVDGGGSGYFLYDDAITTNFPTFTADRTSGSPVLSSIASTTGIYKGQALSGTGIPANTRVLSVDSATQITMTNNATSGAPTSTTVTKEAVAKITDAQFPSSATNMQYINGYFFALDASGNNNIYNSKINDPSDWTAARVIKADWSGANAVGIQKIGNFILCLTGNDIQYFQLAGTSTGSILSRVQNLNKEGVSIGRYPFAVVGNDKYAIAGVAAINAARLIKISGLSDITVVSDDIYSELIKSDYFIRGTAFISGKVVIIFTKTGSTTHIWYCPYNNTWGFLTLSAYITGTDGGTFTKNGESTSFSWVQSNAYTDSDVAFTATIQTEPKTLNGGKPITISRIDLIADTEASGTATIEKTDDDYANWTSLGSFDMTSQDKMVPACGYSRSNVAFRVTHSANTGFRAQALIVEWEPAS